MSQHVGFLEQKLVALMVLEGAGLAGRRTDIQRSSGEFQIGLRSLKFAIFCREVGSEDSQSDVWPPREPLRQVQWYR
jgi:hypothetical protein